MMDPRPFRILMPLALGASCAVAAAQDIQLELNKLEPQPTACRAYLVFDIRGGPAIESLQLDLILFDGDGVIAKRLAVDTAPLRADKTTVKLFDIPDLACEDIQRILVNDVLDCRDETGPRADCIDRLNTSSRAAAPLVK